MMDTIEVAVAKQRKRRVWSDDEKRTICAQTRVPGMSVSQVARRYDVNANLVFTWLRDRRFAEVGLGADAARFLPVEVVEGHGPAAEVATASIEHRIEIELAGGHRMRISGSYDPEALARLIRGLSA
jgi:transposase